MRSIEIIVPRNSVDKFHPHPELHGDFIVTLKNGMVTDVFYDEEGYYRTITNNTKLIDYLNSQKLSYPTYFFRNGVFAFRDITNDDYYLVNEMMTNTKESISLRFKSLDCNQNNVESLPQRFIFMFYWIEVGIVKKIIETNHIKLVLYLYNDDFVRGIDKKLALETLKWMLEDKNSLI